MTPEQYKSWRDFSTRMARTLFWNSVRPTGTWIEKMVISALDGIQQEAPGIKNWDESDRSSTYVCDYMDQIAADEWDYSGIIGKIRYVLCHQTLQGQGSVRDRTG